jgi:stage IV sporulation protein FB
VKISIHPLFLGVIIFCAFFGGFLMTLIFVLTALLHECGHIFCAARMGYKCEKIKLMPYGAAAVCDIDGISLRDELCLAVAGPAVNALICIFVAGLWWFYPETYAYTDTVMLANAGMFVINLLPAYPLDGGRVAKCLLLKLTTPKVTKIILRCSCIVLAAAFIVLFFTLKYNVTCLIFGLFLLCSALEKEPQAVKINYSSAGKLKRGMVVKYVLVEKSLTYKDAVKFLDERNYVVLQLYDGKIMDEITQDELYEGMLTHGIYDRVFE